MNENCLFHQTIFQDYNNNVVSTNINIVINIIFSSDRVSKSSYMNSSGDCIELEIIISIYYW